MPGRRRPVSPAVLAVLALVVCAELLSRFLAPVLIDRGRMTIAFKREMIRAGGRGDDVIFLGSSHVAAFDAAAMEKDFPGLGIFNYAVPNTSSIRQHTRELAVICARFARQKPRLVILSIPMASLFDYDASLMPGPLPRDGKSPDLDSVYWTGSGHPLALVRVAPVIEQLVRSGRLRTPFDLVRLVRESRGRLERMRATNGQMLFGEDDRMDPARLRDFFALQKGCREFLDFNIADMGRMLEYAAGQGVKVTFVNMPVPEELTADMNALGLLATMRARMRGLEGKYPGFRFAEAAEFYSWPLNFFSDPLFHVNRDGAAAMNGVFRGRYLGRILKDADLV